MRWLAAWVVILGILAPALSWVLTAQAQAVALAGGIGAVAPDPGPPPPGVVAVATLSAWQAQADAWWSAEVARVLGR